MKNFVNMNSRASFVTMFNGLNFSEWKEQIEYHLGLHDLDLSLLEEKPLALNENSIAIERATQKSWERSNRLNFKSMRMTL